MARSEKVGSATSGLEGLALVDDLKRLHRRLDHADGFIRWAGAVAVGAGTIGAIAL